MSRALGVHLVEWPQDSPLLLSLQDGLGGNDVCALADSLC